jgi:hypothetical protein
MERTPAQQESARKMNAAMTPEEKAEAGRRGAQMRWRAIAHWTPEEREAAHKKSVENRLANREARLEEEARDQLDPDTVDHREIIICSALLLLSEELPQPGRSKLYRWGKELIKNAMNSQLMRNSGVRESVLRADEKDEDNG